MTVQEDLRKSYIVAVNEYTSGRWDVGHINITFIDHGSEVGTYGLNSRGLDVAGKYHPQGKIGPVMSGGVFSEGHKQAMTHYVIVSRSNFSSMLVFAQSQAKLTAQKDQKYGILTNNCSDFVYRVFSHSDLPERYRDIRRYLKDKREPVAIYTDRVFALYADKAKGRPEPAEKHARHLMVVRLIGDALAYWPES